MIMYEATSILYIATSIDSPTSLKLLLLRAKEAILNNVSPKQIRQQIICFAIAFKRNYVHILSVKCM